MATTYRPHTCGDADCAALEAAGRRCAWCWGGFPAAEPVLQLADAEQDRMNAVLDGLQNTAAPAMTCTVHGDDACGTGLDPVGAQDCDEATPAAGLVRCSCGAIVLSHLVATHAMLDHAEVAR